MKFHGLIFSMFLLAPLGANATPPSPLAAADACPVNMALGNEEINAFTGLNVALSHLRTHYGKPTFHTKLNQILAAEWPEKKVVEIGATFMERVLNRVDQEYLRDEIQLTVGLEHPDWLEFERTMRTVTIFGRRSGNKHGDFTRKTERLIESIKRARAPDVMKARALARLANQFIFVERWSAINWEIIQQRGAAAGQQFLMNMLGFGATGILVASLVYSGPIVAGAGVFAAKFASDVGVALQLMRLGQVVAGGGMGFVGAPVALVLTDSTVNVLNAQRASLNNGTVYACELNKQIEAWKARGVSPYLSAAVAGGGIGLGGGALTLTRAGAQVVLYATTFGVGVAQVYSLGQMSDNVIRSLAAYREAMIKFEAGDREGAIASLRLSREYSQAAGERALESIIVGALSVSIAQSFKAALIQGEAQIRVMFANSSDTLPLAANIAIDTVQKVATAL